MVELKLYLAKNNLFKLVNANLKPMIYEEFQCPATPGTTFLYRNTIVYVIQSARSSCSVLVMNKEIDTVLNDIKSSHFEVNKELILDLVSCRIKLNNDAEYRDKLYILGCCFGYPESTCSLFSEECCQTYKKDNKKLRKDRVFIDSHSLGLTIVGYKEHPKSIQDAKHTLRYLEDMAKIING